MGLQTLPQDGSQSERPASTLSSFWRVMVPGSVNLDSQHHRTLALRGLFWANNKVEL